MNDLCELAGSWGALAIYDVRRVDTDTTIASWARTRHDGSALGTASRMFAVLAGWTPAAGICRWLAVAALPVPHARGSTSG